MEIRQHVSLAGRKKFWNIVFSFLLVLTWYSQAHLEEQDFLKENFKNPPKEYTMLPFWAWNGTLEPDKLIWQIDQMTDKSIYGAFMHARVGIDSGETPYFSDGWWQAVEAVVKYGHKVGFFACLYDEDKWPSGSAGGRTVAADPEAFSKKGLRYEKWEITGPRILKLEFTGHIVTVLAATMVSEETVDPESIVDISAYLGKDWKVPKGKWAIIAFTQIRQDDQIDYLDKEAVGKFIEITHEEYYRRFGEYFGATIPGIFFDEIYANARGGDLVWTDDFLEQFNKIKGYDLKKYLPLLVYNGGDVTVKIRCDYFDVWSTLYTHAWFKQYADWCEAHGIWITGHTIEDFNSYTSQGNYFHTWAPVQMPGTDNEDFRYSFPRRIHWYKPKQLSSVAHINGRQRAVVEAMGGGGWTIPLEEYRYGTSMLAVFGINMFIPHLFHYAIDAPYRMDDWPPSWFFRNPYWKYFKSLADFTSRVSFLCSLGRHVCDVAILFPITSQWASAMVGGESESVDLMGIQFNEIQEILLDNCIDYDMIDPETLIRADISDGKLSVAEESYSVLILPSLTGVRQGVAEKIKDFVKHGGKVVALSTLPYSSMEKGMNDPVVMKNVEEVFGFDPRKIRNGYFEINESYKNYYLTHTNEKGGKAYFTKRVKSVPQILSECINPDVTISNGHSTGLRLLHRRVKNREIYFLVNEQKVPRTWRVSFRDGGMPGLWHPETGAITQIDNYATSGDRVELPLAFKPWEAYFVVFDTEKVKPQNVLLTDTDLEGARIEKITGKRVTVKGWGRADVNKHFVKLEKKIKNRKNSYKRRWDSKVTVPSIELGKEWEFIVTPKVLDCSWISQVDSAELELPIMRFRPERARENGENLGWALTDFDDSHWRRVKIKDTFSQKVGCQRYLSSWDASWINYYDYTQHWGVLGGERVFFKRMLHFNTDVVSAFVCVTADQAYKLQINGKAIGKDDDWKSVESYEITPLLQNGDNILTVEVTDARGLLLQGLIELVGGEQIVLHSDNQWEASLDGEMWQPAYSYIDPPQQPWGEVSFNENKITFPATLWYRQVLPIGIKAVKTPYINGEYQLFVNGQEIEIPDRVNQVDVSHLILQGKNVLTVKVVAHDYSGGILEPLVLVCGRGQVEPGSWTAQGLDWYSGRALYSKEVDIPEFYVGKDKN